MRTLTFEEVKAFYDQFGDKQDKQSFYEEPALKALCASADFANARSIFELGCGTGRFALDLLLHHLPEDARYTATEASTTMLDLATGRLSPFHPRVSITLAGNQPSVPLESASIDRFIATYVLDLLPDKAQRQFLDEAKRVLRPEGLLCLAGITPGISPLSRLVMGIWQRLFERNPRWVGGCRPSRITGQLHADDWSIRSRVVVVAFGVASEVIIAAPAATAFPGR